MPFIDRLRGIIETAVRQEFASEIGVARKDAHKRVDEMFDDLQVKLLGKGESVQ